MTPKRDEFEKKLEAETDRHIHERLIGEGVWALSRRDFRAGARWSREQTIEEVLGLLRSQDAYDFMCNEVGKYRAQYIDVVKGDNWASWLEKRLKGEG